MTAKTTASASSTSSITSGSPLLSASPSDNATPSVVYLTSDIASATASTVSTGAAATLSVSNILFQTGLALALAALGFTVML